MTKRKVPADCMPMCNTCAFFERPESIKGGICRRYPPQLIGAEDNTFSSVFPIVEEKDWCGEYKRQLQD